MKVSLNEMKKAYSILKDYNGENPYLITLKNEVYAYKSSQLNDFQIEFVLRNYNTKPKLINKIAKIANWWGEKKKEEWNTEFTPEKLLIGWYIGDTSSHYAFFAKYRKSVEAKLMFAPKKAILTPFLDDDWHLKEIDFKPYNERSGRELYPHQEDAVKFLTSKKKAILADDMGLGKTVEAIVSALVDDYKHVLIVCPASVKETWQNELKSYVDESDIVIVNGNEWKDAKFTIINYDILDNFYTIPTQVVKTKELNVDDSGNVVKQTKERTIVSKSNKIISEAMSKSQLFTSHFDLFIIDEAHRLSNATSNRSKILKDLVNRSKPTGIYELTGTPITNRPINFFNLLKLIDAPIAADWKTYVERYCDGKSFYKKNERNAYTTLFLKNVHKSSWYDLTYDEKKQLDDILDRKCHKIWKTEGHSNLDELQEVIKPYYLRRKKEDFNKIVNKTVKYLHYELTRSERQSYDDVWNEYVSKNAENKSVDEILKYQKLTENTILRQWLAHTMLKRTLKLVNKCIKKNQKVIVFCSYDDEVNSLRDALGDLCVYHNGKITEAKKNKAVEAFQNDSNVKVFIGNITSAGVGLTLTAAHIAIFNSFSWVSGDNLQAEDRVHRINQTKDCTIYYQVFKDTFYEEMLEKVRGKQNVIDNIIVKEGEK
jgi:SWI/SNF-related matrix-associated actin-dependent regulator 1 of chromatin subfamily A